MPKLTEVPALKNTKTTSYVETCAGKIAYVESTGAGPTIFMIHGNSATKEAFEKQFDTLGAKYHLIAIDLPGHGMSDDALDPKATYSFPGYADVMIEVAARLNVTAATLLGWSLGGHIALEMSHKNPALVSSLILTGTPPIELTKKGIHAGFNPFEGVEMMGCGRYFTPEEAKKFITLAGYAPEDKELGIVTPNYQFFIDAAVRTDGAARENMFNSLGAGVGNDERKLVLEYTKPIMYVMERDG